MQTAVKTCLVAMLMLALAACSSSAGKEFSMTKGEQIREGVTTKEQVRALLGEPESTTKTAYGPEAWTYVHVFAGPFSSRSKCIMIYFDKRGIVQTISRSDTKGH